MADKEQLLSEARAAKENSYSPYSNFKVGASVLADDGTVYTGTNIENASYGLSICAERVAIFNAISAGSRKIYSIAVSCPESDSESAMMPCGACLQVMSEFSTEKTTVLIDNVGEFKLSDLLKKPFKLT